MSELTALRIGIRRLPHAAGLPLPAYASPEAAGLDLLAAVTEDHVLAPGARALIPTGVAMALPPGFEGQVRPRSDLALEHGLTVLNAPGTIDPDDRGEVGVILINLGQAPVTVTRGMRIALLIVAPHCFVAWDDRTGAGEALAATARGARGAAPAGTTE